MLQAAIFDMDGLMVDSEPFWQQAQLEIFPKLGIHISRQDTINTTGIRIDQIIALYYKQSPWQNLSCKEVEAQIINRVIELVKSNKPMMPGLLEAIDCFQTLNMRLALASSSPMNLIQATLEALNLQEMFEVVVSAEHLAYGKPHPEVYLNAAKELNILPQSCVALEDSFTGLIAATAAQMKTIVIPEKSQAHQARFCIADKKLESLGQISPGLVQSLSDKK